MAPPSGELSSVSEKMCIRDRFARNEQVANDRYEHLTRLVELYK